MLGDTSYIQRNGKYGVVTCITQCCLLWQFRVIVIIIVCSYQALGDISIIVEHEIVDAVNRRTPSSILGILENLQLDATQLQVFLCTFAAEKEKNRRLHKENEVIGTQDG